MKNTLTVIGFGLLIIIIVVLGKFLYNLERQFNFNFSYKSMVQQTVRDMVKKEALK